MQVSNRNRKYTGRDRIWMNYRPYLVWNNHMCINSEGQRWWTVKHPWPYSLYEYCYSVYSDITTRYDPISNRRLPVEK